MATLDVLVKRAARAWTRVIAFARESTRIGLGSPDFTKEVNSHERWMKERAAQTSKSQYYFGTLCGHIWKFAGKTEYYGFLAATNMLTFRKGVSISIADVHHKRIDKYSGSLQAAKG
jgi:hypothetical protein